MLTNRDIIFFGDDWGRYPSTVQYIGRQLATHNRMIWVGSLGLRRPRLHIRDMKRVVEKVIHVIRPTRGRPGDQAVTVLAPPIIPYHDLGVIRRHNMRVVMNAVRRAMDDLAFRRPVVLTSSPIVADVLAAFPDCVRAYLCLDDFTRFEGAFRSLAAEEQRMLTHTDVCFAVSESLAATRVPPSGRVYHLPQGVDVEHFSRSDGPRPAALQSIRKPVIGFFGILAPWVDYDLIIRVATAYPDATVVLLGRVSTDIARLATIGNIVHLGEIPYAQLPAYASAFDVGLIPFVVNELTIAANPLKLLEYLALGIPVVSTALPEVARFGAAVAVAQSADEFVAQVGRALRERSQSASLERRRIAERYSWRGITDDLSDRILEIERDLNRPSAVGREPKG